MSAAFSGALPNSGCVPKTPLEDPNKFRRRTTGKWRRSVEESRPGAGPIGRASAQDSGEVEGRSSGDDATSGALHDPARAREDCLGSGASGVELPAEESAELDPRFAFGESTLIVHMCTDCRAASRGLECVEMENGDRGLVVNLCTICRALLNTRRRIKFFQHELACIKRRQMQ